MRPTGVAEVSGAMAAVLHRRIRQRQLRYPHDFGSALAGAVEDRRRESWLHCGSASPPEIMFSSGVLSPTITPFLGVAVQVSGRGAAARLLYKIRDEKHRAVLEPLPGA